jgi:hypothetical protein
MNLLACITRRRPLFRTRAPEYPSEWTNDRRDRKQLLDLAGWDVPLARQWVHEGFGRYLLLTGRISEDGRRADSEGGDGRE